MSEGYEDFNGCMASDCVFGRKPGQNVGNCRCLRGLDAQRRWATEKLIRLLRARADEPEEAMR